MKNTDYGFEIENAVEGNDLRARVKSDAWGAGLGCEDDTVVTGVWYYHAMTWDDTSYYNMLYTNDSLVDTYKASTNHSTNSQDLIFGGWTTNSEMMDGKVDEIRISSVNRSTAWIKTTYNTTNDPTNFTAFGSQKTQNEVPELKNPSPSNGAVGISRTPELTITVKDGNADEMDVYFYTNVTGSWGLIDSNLSVYNGTYLQTNESMNAKNTTYWWSVNATDGQAWTNRTYSFKTKGIDIYYFDSYDIGGEEWETNPASMTDDSLTNFANTSTDAQVQLLTGNNCTGENLGTITKVELRAYGNYTNGLNAANIKIRPVFDGSDDGDDHTWDSVGTAKGWSSWFNITEDTNAPASWSWTNIVTLDCDIVSDGTPSFDLSCYDVEIRVTFS
jgi:hypothetical protein